MIVAIVKAKILSDKIDELLHIANTLQFDYAPFEKAVIVMNLLLMEITLLR